MGAAGNEVTSVDLELIQELGVVLGLGLLVGFQREWVESKIAGIRTFALITLFGALLLFWPDRAVTD